MIQIQYSKLPFSTIKEPLPGIRAIWAKHHQPAAVKVVFPQINGRHVLTREAALALSILHPLIVTDKNHHCICNQRVLEILTIKLRPDDIIPVGIVPATTSQDQIEQLILSDILLSTMTYSPTNPVKEIFKLSETLPSTLTETLSPALAHNIFTRSVALGTASGTLYKWLKDQQNSNP